MFPNSTSYFKEFSKQAPYQMMYMSYYQYLHFSGNDIMMMFLLSLSFRCSRYNFHLYEGSTGKVHLLFKNATGQKQIQVRIVSWSVQENHTLAAKY